jgi:hypothetical protein
MFSVGAAMPLVMVVVSPASALVPIVSAEIASREISDNMLLRIVISLGKSTAALRDEALIKQLEASGARVRLPPLAGLVWGCAQAIRVTEMNETLTWTADFVEI